MQRYCARFAALIWELLAVAKTNLGPTYSYSDTVYQPLALLIYVPRHGAAVWEGGRDDELLAWLALLHLQLVFCMVLVAMQEMSFSQPEG